MTIKQLKGEIRYILNLMEAGEYSKDYAIDEITNKFIEWHKANWRKLILQVIPCITTYREWEEKYNTKIKFIVDKHFTELEEKW